MFFVRKPGVKFAANASKRVCRALKEIRSLPIQKYILKSGGKRPVGRKAFRPKNTKIYAHNDKERKKGGV
jgi:hypothetical protein